MPPTKARKGRDRAAKQCQSRAFLNLCALLAEDKNFLTLISEYTDRTILDAHIFATAQTTEYKHNLTTKSNAFANVKTLLGTYTSEELSISIRNLHNIFREHSLKSKSGRVRTQSRKNITAKRVGFHPTSALRIESLKPIYLSKLSIPHPTPKAYVYERTSDENPIPTPPNMTDTSCGKCDTLLPMIESKLQCVIPATESAIIRDRDTNAIIAVIIRDFAQDYYDHIKCWAINLINDSIDRRTLSQRNGPGKLARVGVTDGPRHARVFGWSRSLKKKFRKEHQSDHDKHERDISSLFGLFYSLL
jgi:hypothetical protein